MFVIYHSQPGGMAPLNHDRGRAVGQPRQFKTRVDAEQVATARKLVKPTVIFREQEMQHERP